MFKMNGCGWCTEAEKRLQSSIDNGTVQVKSSTEAPKIVTGFPAFLSTVTGKIKEGCPKDIESLNKDLGHSTETYHSVLTQTSAPVLRQTSAPVLRQTGGYATLDSCWTTKETAAVENYSHCSSCAGAKTYNTRDY